MATPEEMARSMVANLPLRTGRSLEEWMEWLGNQGELKHGQIVKLLKSEHGVTHGFANLIAHRRLNPEPGTGSSAPAVDPLEVQYAGAKAGLKPIYERLLESVGEFGSDVEIAPKKAYVSLRRRKQFAIVQPSTKTRLDVGLILKGEPATERLEMAGSFNSMVTHRVRLTAVSEVDQELVDWLRLAYERS